MAASSALDPMTVAAAADTNAKREVNLAMMSFQNVGKEQNEMETKHYISVFGRAKSDDDADQSAS